MIHPDLKNALLPIIGEVDSLEEAWYHLRPIGGAYVRGSFWRVLTDKIRFAKTERRALSLVRFIRENRHWAEAKGRPWPPIKLVTKPVFQPAPNALKI